MGERNLVLIGFMGSGKTAVARAISGMSRRKMLDIDRRIESKIRMSVASIFRKMGERRFRDMEHREVRALAGKTGLVVSVGGGAAVFPRNRAWLRRAGLVVYLRVPVPVLVRRLAHSTGRPLLRSARGNRRALARLVGKLLKKRSPAYNSTAHFAVDGGRGDPEAVARRILARIRVNRRGSRRAGL